jgi:NNP family nitrate/nitrite transporter-like MFS transporter
VYYFIGRNAPYFQYREQGMATEEAKAAARQAGQEMFPTGKLKDSLFISARIWKTWVLVAIYFTSFGCFLALTSWLPTYWKSYFATSTILAGALTALYSVLTSLIRVVGGGFTDRLGGENVALMSLTTMLGGAILMSISHNQALSILAEILMALGMGVTNAAVFKIVPQEVPQAVGGASGWVGGIGAFGGFVVPPVLGAIVRSQGDVGYASGFIVLVVLALLSLGLAYLLKRTHIVPSNEFVSKPAQ